MKKKLNFKVGMVEVTIVVTIKNPSQWGVQIIKDTTDRRIPSGWEGMGSLEEHGRRGALFQWIVENLESLFGKEESKSIANQVISLIRTG